LPPDRARHGHGEHGQQRRSQQEQQYLFEAQVAQAAVSPGG
jgi:hypothetical protein